MTGVEAGLASLATEVILRAFIDMAGQSKVIVVRDLDADGVAQWFADDEHVPWCEMAGISPDVVKRYAIHIAVRLHGAAQHPVITRIPQVTVWT